MVNKRKKPNRLKPEKKVRRKATLPSVPEVKVPWRVFSVMALMALVMVAGWHLADRPVRSIVINAPFKRVTAMQIEEVVRANLEAGLLSTDLTQVRLELQQLPWIDEVRLRRQWPDAVIVGVSEQMAAARWGDTGLLNTRGELFLPEARYMPTELPLLQGPEGEQEQVAVRYLQLHATLVEHGFQLLSVALDDRGAWRLQLSSGVEVRLGRENVEQRVERFLQLVTPLIAGRADLVEYIDMRYANGFAIGWVEENVVESGENKDV